MSTNQPNDAGQSGAPDQPTGPRKDEVESLNADDLDIQELDDKLLEDAAGGTEEAVAPCSGHSCGNHQLC